MAAEWEARALWFGLGAATAVLVMVAMRDPEPTAVAERPDAEAPPSAEPSSDLSPSAPPALPSPEGSAPANESVVANTEPDATRTPVAAPPDRHPPLEVSEPVATVDPTPTPEPQPTEANDDPESALAAEGEADAKVYPEPSGDPPEMPMPRMPGMNQLRAKDRWDTEDGTWHLTRTWEVPAPAWTAKDFYESALGDLGMSATVADQGADDEHAARFMVKGRAGTTHVQVAIRQTAGTLRTRVRILWRTRG